MQWCPEAHINLHKPGRFMYTIGYMLTSFGFSSFRIVVYSIDLSQTQQAHV